MKLNSNLLNEVIADAKAVRETAVQTAISRLKETFEPTVRSLISQKLREEEGMEDDEDMTMPEPDETDVEYSEDEYDDIDAETESPADESETMSDEDLEEILAELEHDSQDYMEEGEDEMDMPTAPEHEMTEEDDEEITAEALDELIREMEDEMENEDTLGESWVKGWGQDEYDPSNDFENIYEGRKFGKSTGSNSKLVQENRQLKTQLQQAKAQLKEAYKAITTQNTAINEVNLLNSKLLFLTKITSKHRMTPEKQVKILEAFDRAKTVREVKLVYATICESLDRAQNSKSFGKSFGIVESASKPTRTIKGNLNENYAFVSRWQELAGITK